jgi:hypothetical protein
MRFVRRLTLENYRLLPTRRSISVSTILNNGQRIKMAFQTPMNTGELRVVHREAIFVLKVMSERGGSDIEQIRIGMMNFKIDSKSIEDDVIQFSSRAMSDPPLSDIDMLFIRCLEFSI